jgi:ADP-ribosylglycohydrolase
MIVNSFVRRDRKCPHPDLLFLPTIRIAVACAFARIIPTVCLYAGEGDLIERVKETVKVHQTNPRAIRFCCAMAKILEQILLGMSLRESLEELVNQAMGSKTNFTTDDAEVGDACLFALMEAKMKDLDQFVEALDAKDSDDEQHGGVSAQFPSAFEIPMFLFYKAMADGEINEAAYIKAIRSNIKAGGETCLRAIVLGAVFGAACGSVPESFVEKFPKETMDTVDKEIAKICSLLN